MCFFCYSLYIDGFHKNWHLIIVSTFLLWVRNFNKNIWLIFLKRLSMHFAHLNHFLKVQKTFKSFWKLCFEVGTKLKFTRRLRDSFEGIFSFSLKWWRLAKSQRNCNLFAHLLPTLFLSHLTRSYLEGFPIESTKLKIL